MSLEIVNVFLTNKFQSELKSKENNSDTDVIVQLNSGEKYIATFFEFNNLDALREKNLKSGTFLNGRYFWMKNMLLIDDCSLDNVNNVVENLISEGDFFDVFKKL